MLKKGCGCNKSTNVTPELPKDWGIPKIDLNPIKPDCNQLRKPWDCPDILPAVLINNNPDNEDITSVIEGNLEVLKFADKAYNPMTYSGMGRVFLRKNLVDDDTTLSCPSKVNKLELWMFNDKDGQPLTNTIFIVLYDYDLKGGFITIPCNSILLFLGGSFNNGTVVLTDTLVLPHMLEYSKYMNCAIKGSFAKGQTFYSDGVIKVWNGVSWVEFAGSTEFTELLNGLKEELNVKITKNTTDILTISNSLNNYALKVHLHVLSDITGLLTALSNKTSLADVQTEVRKLKLTHNDNKIQLNYDNTQLSEVVDNTGNGGGGGTSQGGVSLADVQTEIGKLSLHHPGNQIQLKYGDTPIGDLVNDNAGSGGGGGDSSDDGLPGNILIYFLKTNSSTVPSTPANAQIANLNSNSGVWLKNAPNHEPGTYIWMSLIYETPAKTYGNWSTPVLIDDDSKGSAGSDTTDREYIYALSNIENFAQSGICDPSGYDANPNDNYIPCSSWKDNPQGVSQEMRFEFISIRTKNENRWSKFSKPVLWSSYGLNGTDGDGVEYIFFKGGTPPLDTDLQNPYRWYTNKLSKDGEVDTNKVKYNSDEYIKPNSGWVDDPVSIEAGESVWVSIRKYRNDTDTASAETTDAYWHQYSKPALWSHYGADGIAAGILDFDNETMTVSIKEDTNLNYEFNDEACGYIFYGKGQLPITNITFDGLYSGQEEITISDSNAFSVSILDNKVSVHISEGVLDFSQSRSYSLRFTAHAADDTTEGLERTGTIKLVGIKSGKGESYRLFLNTTVIKKQVGTQTGVFIPESITPKLLITRGGNITKKYTPTELEGLSEKFRIKYGINIDALLSSPDSIASNIIEDYIVVALLYDGNIIDQETVFVIEDGQDGIPGTTYSIIPLSSDVSYNGTLTRGTITFLATRLIGSNPIEYLTELNSWGSINLGNNITPTLTRDTYTASIESNTELNYIVVQLLVSDTVVSSILIPVIKNGNSGTQTLEHSVLRQVTINSDSTVLKEFFDGRTPDNGIYYLDFVKWNGIVDGKPVNNSWGTYLCVSHCTIAPNTIPTSPNFVRLDYEFSEVVSYLIAELGFINSLSVHQLTLLANDNQTVVGGMTSGSTLPTEIKDDYTNTDGIRIWAGVPSNGDINTAPFTVDSSGKLKAKNAEIVGSVKATEFQTGEDNKPGIVVLNDPTIEEKDYFSENGKADIKKAYMYYNGNSMNIAICVSGQWKNLDLTNALLPIAQLPTFGSFYYKFTKDETTKGFKRELITLSVKDYNYYCNNSPVANGTIIYKWIKSVSYGIVSTVSINKNLIPIELGLYQKCTFNDNEITGSENFTMIGEHLNISTNGNFIDSSESATDRIYCRPDRYVSYLIQDSPTTYTNEFRYLTLYSLYEPNSTPLSGEPVLGYLYTAHPIENLGLSYTAITLLPDSDDALIECGNSITITLISSFLSGITFEKGTFSLGGTGGISLAPVDAADIRYPSSWTGKIYTNEDLRVASPEPIAP